MRIMLLASAYHPDKGGVEETVRQLSRLYRQQGHAVLVVVPLWPHSRKSYEVVEGQVVRRLPMPLPSSHPRSLLSFCLRFLPATLATVYLGLRWKPDVVHVQCVGPNGLYALLLSWLVHTPLVVTSQGEQTMDANRIYDKVAAQRWVLRQLLRRADAVTGCSADTLHNLELYGHVGSGATVVPNGVDVAEFAGAVPGRLYPRPYVFAIGRHVWNKGFDVLLRAFARVAPCYPDVDLVIAGDGPEHESLIGLSRELQLEGRVAFPGYTERTATVAYFLHARLFVLPSLHEPFGIVNLEAMAAGKAIVATAAGGVAEIVRDGVDGVLVPPGDVEALAKALDRMLGNPDLSAQFGAHAYHIVRERYTWERIASAYLAIYAGVLSRGRRTAQIGEVAGG